MLDAFQCEADKTQKMTKSAHGIDYGIEKFNLSN